MKFISVDEVQNYIREVYLLQQNNSSLYYQFQYISIDVTESDITMIKSLKRKQINTDTLRGSNFADGPFRNILRISRMGLVKISRIDKAALETEG